MDQRSGSHCPCFVPCKLDCGTYFSWAAIPLLPWLSLWCWMGKRRRVRWCNSSYTSQSIRTRPTTTPATASHPHARNQTHWEPVPTFIRATWRGGTEWWAGACKVGGAWSSKKTASLTAIAIARSLTSISDDRSEFRATRSRRIMVHINQWAVQGNKLSRVFVHSIDPRPFCNSFFFPFVGSLFSFILLNESKRWLRAPLLYSYQCNES